MKNKVKKGDVISYDGNGYTVLGPSNRTGDWIIESLVIPSEVIVVNEGFINVNLPDWANTILDNLKSLLRRRLFQENSWCTNYVHGYTTVLDCMSLKDEVGETSLSLKLNLMIDFSDNNCYGSLFWSGKSDSKFKEGVLSDISCDDDPLDVYDFFDYVKDLKFFEGKTSARDSIMSAISSFTEDLDKIDECAEYSDYLFLKVDEIFTNSLKIVPYSELVNG